MRFISLVFAASSGRTHGREHKRACTPAYVHTRTRTHANAHTRTHTHTRTTARTSARTRARAQLLTGRGNVCKCGRIVGILLVHVCHLFVVSHDALSDSNFFSRTVQFSAGKNVRNHLKFVVWSCEVSIDILCQLTRIDACALTLWQVFSRCRSRARFARSLASLRFAHLLAGSLRSLASLASLRSLALLRTRLLGINAGLKF